MPKHSAYELDGRGREVVLEIESAGFSVYGDGEIHARVPGSPTFGRFLGEAGGYLIVNDGQPDLNDGTSRLHWVAQQLGL